MKHEYLDYIKKESNGTEYEVSDTVLDFTDQILSILNYQPKNIYIRQEETLLLNGNCAFHTGENM